MTCRYTLSKQAKLKSLAQPVLGNIQKTSTLSHYVWKCKQKNKCLEGVWQCLLEKNMSIPDDPETPLLDLYTTEAHGNIFEAFCIAQNEINPRSSNE